MKKFFALLLSMVIFTLNPVFAISELYYFKNIKTTEVELIVNESLTINGYKIVKDNPYYAVLENGNEIVIIVLQQSGDNMFYYYQSDKDMKPNKAVLKEVKRRNIVCEQSFNKGIISIYDDIAEGIRANEGNPVQYSFKDEPVILQPPPQERYNNHQKSFSGHIAQIAAGTKFNVYLQNAINTATASEGDTVVAVIQDGITYNNEVIIPQGSLVYGTLSKARNATYGSMNGRVVIKFNKIVTVDNQIYTISAEDIDFTVANEGKVGESVKNAASTAIVGALLGLVFGLLSDNGHAGRSAAIGAGIGAGSSVVYSAAEKGVDAEIPSFTEIELTLKDAMYVNVSK